MDCKFKYCLTLSLAVVLATGCAIMQCRWEAARATDTILAYYTAPLYSIQHDYNCDGRLAKVTRPIGEALTVNYDEGRIEVVLR